MPEEPVQELKADVRSQLVDNALGGRPFAVGIIDLDGTRTEVVIRQIDGSSGDRDILVMNDEVVAQIQIDADGDLIERDAGHSVRRRIKNPDNIIKRLRMASWADPETAAALIDQYDAAEIQVNVHGDQMLDRIEELALDLQSITYEAADVSACLKLADGERVECTNSRGVSQDPAGDESLSLMISRSPDQRRATVMFNYPEPDDPHIDHSEIELTLVEDESGRTVRGHSEQGWIEFKDLHPERGYTIGSGAK